MQAPVLATKGTAIVDSNGQEVLLRGFGLGGWMNMENFITGYPTNEEAQREALRKVLGKERYEFFFDRFLEYFFERDDARFIASLGLNLLRLPINYRHFESDMEPFVIKEEGFKHLDRVIDLCAEQQIYTIIDLHALPGYQNQAWHSDNPTHKALFWQHKHIRTLMQPIEETFAREFPDYHPFPFGPQWLINRLVRHILLAEPLIEEFAALFKGMDKQDIESLMQSFRLKNCLPRAELVKILSTSD